MHWRHVEWCSATGSENQGEVFSSKLSAISSLMFAPRLMPGTPSCAPDAP